MLSLYDGRALAAFRVGLGTVLLYELVWFYWKDRCAMFGGGDDSLFPPRTISDKVLWPNLHTLFPGCGWTSTVMAAQIVSAALLAMFGLQPCAMLLWMVSCSQMRRNPLIVCGSDTLKRCCLMWATFMPIASPPRAGHSWAVAGLKLQVALIYASAAICKIRADPDGAPGEWRDGTAVQTVLLCCDYRTPLGEMLAEMPEACRALTYATLVTEGLAPFMLLLGRGAALKATIAVLFGFHIGAGLTMELGTFSQTTCIALLVFWPPPKGEEEEAEMRRPSFAVAALLAMMSVCHVDHILCGLGAIENKMSPMVVDWTRPRTWPYVAAHKLGQLDVWRMFQRPPIDCGTYRLPGRRGPRPVFDVGPLLYGGGTEAAVDWSPQRYAVHRQMQTWGAVLERCAERGLYVLESLAGFACNHFDLDEVSIVLVQQAPPLNVPENLTLYSTQCEPP